MQSTPTFYEFVVENGAGISLVSVWERRIRPNCLVSQSEFIEAVHAKIAAIHRARFPKNRLVVSEAAVLCCMHVAGLFRVALGDGGPVVEFRLVPQYVEGAPAEPAVCQWLAGLRAMWEVARSHTPRVSFVGDSTSTIEALSPEFLARALVSELQLPKRAQLWEYVNRSWTAFAISGEVLPDSLAFPMVDGFEQSSVEMEPDGRYWRVLEAGLWRVMQLSHDQSLKQNALMLMKGCGFEVPSVIPSLPRQFYEWDRAYSAAIALLRHEFGDAEVLAIDTVDCTLFATEKLWEKFCIGLVSQAVEGLHGALVCPGKAPIASSKSFGVASSAPWCRKINPDIEISKQPSPGRDEQPREVAVLDAKYKLDTTDDSSREHGAPRIPCTVNREDFYQAVAYLSARAPGEVSLLYPAYAEAKRAVFRSEVIRLLDGKKIHAFKINIWLLPAGHAELVSQISRRFERLVRRRLVALTDSDSLSL